MLESEIREKLEHYRAFMTILREFAEAYFEEFGGPRADLDSVEIIGDAIDMTGWASYCGCHSESAYLTAPVYYLWSDWKTIETERRKKLAEKKAAQKAVENSKRRQEEKKAKRQLYKELKEEFEGDE